MTIFKKEIMNRSLFCFGTRIAFFILILFFISDTALAIRLKIATLSPQGSMWMKEMQKAANEVARQTDNRVTFKFYPGGVMGNDKAVLRKIRVGQLHGGAVVSGSMSRFFPANQLYAQPLKFKTTEEIEYVRQHLDPFIIDGLEQNGFVVFGLIGGGFAYIMSKNKIETVDDLKKQKTWIPDNDKISQESIKAFGVSPIPLPLSDVRTGLQSGLIDTVANSPIGAVILQWHTQVKYVIDLPLIFLHAVLAIDKKPFSKISPSDQAIVRQIFSNASKTIDSENKKDNQKALETLKKRGITFITPPEHALNEWLETGRVATEKMIESGVIPKEKVEEIDMHLKTFHSKKQ
jgi:TRAP-type C4-dicarboxylate transport system substrate-binding protein